MKLKHVEINSRNMSIKRQINEKKNKLAFKFTYFNSYENILLQTMDIAFFLQNLHLFSAKRKGVNKARP